MKTPDAVTALAALAHDKRLAAYRLLVEAGPKGLPAGTIARRLDIAPPSLTFHLQNLQRAGLVKQERLSRQMIYSADYASMKSLVGFLTENCCAASESCVAARPARRVRAA